VIRAYDFHPPDDVRLREFPAPGVLRHDDDMFVAEVRDGDNVRRLYAFRHHWFRITCITDLTGAFIDIPHSSVDGTHAFKCDIATPVLRVDGDLYSVDLWLDVVVGSDGTTHAVYDEDDFALARRRGWLSQREAAAARAGLDELLAMLARGRFIEFLTEAYPFGPTSPPPATSTKHIAASEVALLQPRRRPWW
jgi:hypothetical protein